MTNRMRMQLFLDTVNRHRIQPSHESGECCLQARLAAAEVIRMGLDQPEPQAPRAPEAEQAAPTDLITRAEDRAAKSTVGNGRTYPGRPATAAQLRYMADLLRLRDVSNYWREQAMVILRSDNPTFDDANRTLNQLTAMPKLPDAVRERTPRQDFTLRRLLEQRIWPDEVDVDGLSFDQASLLIGALLEAPKKPKVADSSTAGDFPEVGIYKYGEDYYKIQLAVHGSGRRMCKKLDRESRCFRRVTGMSGKLTAQHRVGIEEAKAFGALYGQCVCCGAVLTDDKHAQEGIGPICKKKYF